MLIGVFWACQVAVVSHSWGDNVFRNFLFWAEQEEEGWVEKHIANYINVSGPVLGVPKSVTAMLSGCNLHLIIQCYPGITLVASLHYVCCFDEVPGLLHVFFDLMCKNLG